jgi:hypothetical protein
MPRTIEQGFADFHTNLKATAAEAQATVSHRASIKACLEAKFGLQRMARIGSFGNGTNISGSSDVDYLTVLPTKELNQNSATSLRNVRAVLETRFPNTNVHVDTPAVVCPFGTYKSQHTELVIANYAGEKNGYKFYQIADGDGGWMKICPDAHNAYVAKVDQMHEGKVKPLIRFIKAWKYARGVPIKSFYLEMRVARYAENEPTIIHGIDVPIILNQLLSSELASMQDPTGFSGLIQPCKSTADKEIALSMLNTAATRASKAEQAWVAGEVKESFDWWQKLYDNNFPSYYV